ncbi:hypothetical protein DPMN_160894 [Dreissena polymorpha]|uniref:Uncharacterized protein n=1 Tax=Dreissena polymorpha TaxID=45954 RepID=A0A9D4EP02_DREPO|nr:hypothetical protein DPMN_160894 [Dreissena polymorpha]
MFRIVVLLKSVGSGELGAVNLSKRDQKVGETAEEYAAELKRLYDKAHTRRDYRTRQEDLVRKFLDGLRDEEVRSKN